MAYLLFSHRLRYLQQDLLDSKIRLSIFIIAGECGGLPALVWALLVLYGHHKSGGRISVLVIVLLLCDLLELLLNPYVVTKLLQDENCWETNSTCRIFTSLWSGLMAYGFLLQQVVALEGALTLRHPHCSAHVFFPSCSIITSIIVFICFFLGEFLSFIRFEWLSLLFLPVTLSVTLISCIVTCRAPPQTSDVPYRTKKPSCTVLAFVIFTVILHVTFIILFTVPWHYWDLWVMRLCLMSLRVTTDPLLCVLVYRKDLRLQKGTHAEQNRDIELTQIQSSDPTNAHTAQEI